MSNKQLFEPVTLGGIPCKNRLVRSATFEAGGAVRGAITPLLKSIYAELADGGVGTIITGTMCVSPMGAFSKGCVSAPWGPSARGWCRFRTPLLSSPSPIL